MRIMWLLGLTTGCGYISEAKYDLRLDPDQDGVNIEDDCDSNDPQLGLPRTFFADLDGDGFGDPDSTLKACTLPENASENSLDCDDSRADVNPGATDIFYDGVDSDCDGSNDCDQDGDGFDGSGNEDGTPTTECPNATDCDDGDALIYPTEGATELPFNGEDDDCNVLTGDGDFDGDGFWHANYEAIVIANGREPLPIPEGKGGDCYDWVAEPVEGFDPTVINGFGTFVDPVDVHPNAIEVFYDGVDQNCDGLSDFDQDGDGYNSDAYEDRDGLTGTDCMDESDGSGFDPSLVNVDATETYYDGVDQNCDGHSDYDADFDGYDSMDHGGLDCDDSSDLVSPIAYDEPADGVDQNCDGLEDCYEDLDGDGHGIDSLIPSVDFTCLSGGLSPLSDDCDDDNQTIYPNAPQLCDGLQNLCDGSDLPANEADSDGDGFVECTGWVGDNTKQSGDCLEGNATVNPAASEIVDGLDNNCDTSLLPEEMDVDGDGYISGTFDSAVWAGDINVAGGNDCNDQNVQQYPGAAFNDSTTACLLDADSDGHAEQTERCFELNLQDAGGEGWVVGSIDVIVDGSLQGSYSNAGGLSQLETVCTDGYNIEFVINAPTFDTNTPQGDVDQWIQNMIEIVDTTNGVTSLGMGFASVGSTATFDWNGGIYTDGNTFFMTTNDGALGTDCDDSDGSVYPTAIEQCDGIVNDCNVTNLPADETDVDGDGFVDCLYDSASWKGSAAVVGGLDCDDADPMINPDTVWYVDGDNDQYGTSTSTLTQCEQPSGYALMDGDCNDGSESVHPFAADSADDGIDQNCDGAEDLGYTLCAGIDIEGYYYLACPDAQLWNVAETECQAMGYDGLASLHSASQRDLVATLLTDLSVSEASWIGLHDASSTDVFEWTDGSPFDFDGWTTGQPDDNSGTGGSSPADCAAIDITTGTWSDEFCSESRPFVCSIEMP